MNEEFSPELRKELLDDFYAECDELLIGIRDNLGSLVSASTAADTQSRMESLFRGFHSLKGNAAIAGVRAAEHVAHGVEELLRALTKQTVVLTSARTGLMQDATQVVEQIIRSNRDGKPTPDSTAILLALEQSLREAPGTPVAAASLDETVSTSDSSAGLWRCRFSPSSALDQRGVNLATVRERLGQIGRITGVTPIVNPSASIVFMFTVELRSPPTKQEQDTWEADGVLFEPIAAPRPVSASASQEAKAPLNEPVEVATLTPSHMVRVDLTRLDDLMRIAGEMVIQRSRLEDRIAQHFGGSELLKEIDLKLARSLRELRRGIARVRLVPIAEIFSRIPLVVRDLEPGSGKKVRVLLEGQMTEVDKFLVERLKEPLLHLVRNAFSHGIETSAERQALRKEAEATLTLRATSVGEAVVIQVRDNGRGINAAEVIARARALGVPVPAQVDAAALLAILCAPGFSTRHEADRASGRGVGMAVVANTVRELGGSLTLETTVGQGSEFTLRLPLTLSIADAIIVTVGSEVCAVPQSAVDEIIQVPAQDVRRIRKTETVPYRKGLLPFIRLRQVFGLEIPETEQLTLLVLSTERGATGLVIDHVRTRREIVVRPLADPLVRVPGISGATELGDGRPILILDPHALTEGVVRPPSNLTEPVSA